MTLTKVSTPGIKDEAITLAKLLHGDSNSNGKFLRANNGADPTFEAIAAAVGQANTIQTTDGSGSFTASTFKVDGDVLKGHDIMLEKDSSNVNPVIGAAGGGTHLTFRTDQDGLTGAGVASILDLSGLQLGRKTQYVKLAAPTDQSGQASYTFTFPPISGTNGQALTTNGSGTTSWTTISSDLVDDSSPQLGGNLDTNSHNIFLDDDHKVIWGNDQSADLHIFHESSSGSGNIYNATGELRIRTNDLRLKNLGNTQTYIKAVNNGAVELYNSGNKKLETTSDGVLISGELDVHKSGTGDIFHVQGNGTGAVVAKVENAYNSDNDRFAILELKSGKGSIRFNSNGDSNEGAITYEMATNAMIFSTNNATERMRIDSSGNVLIRSTGLNNSSVNGQALQVNGTTRPTLILRGNSTGGNTCEIQFADNSGSDSDSGTRVGLIKYEHAGTYANHMHFHTNETERVVISHDGKLGVDNSPANLAGFAERLQVTGAYSNQYAAAFKIRQSSGSLMRFSTTDPTTGNFQLCGSITVNGTSTSFNTSSDYRLKENDVKISDGITRVKQLRPIRFNWKADSSTIEDGFFAHEVQPIVPESVSGEKDATVDSIGEGYQKIDHSKLVPLLTAALQEEISKREALETRVAALEAV